MRPLFAALFLTLALGAPVAAQTIAIEHPMTKDDLPPGYPPKMGDITGTLGDKPVVWETFDYSIGAFDASAQVRADWNTKVISLNLMGMKPGRPDDDRQRIWIQGEFGTTLTPGPTMGVVEVQVLRGKDIDGPRLVSDGAKVELVLDSIGPKVADSYSRRMTGHVTARLCPVNWMFRKCQNVMLHFDTDVQIDGDFPIKP